MILASGPQAVTVRAGDDTNGDNEYSNDEIFMRKTNFNALVGQFSILPFVVPVCLHLLYIGCTLTTTLNTISWFASLCIRPSMLMLMLMLVVVDCVSRAGLLSLPTSMIILS